MATRTSSTKAGTTRCIILRTAERALAANPDRAEIMADLEQAIRQVPEIPRAHKSIVTAAEIEQIVDRRWDRSTGPGRRGSGPGGAAAQAQRAVRREEPAAAAAVQDSLGRHDCGRLQRTRRLLRRGCDAHPHRFRARRDSVTKGAAMLGYVGMMFVVPEAKTPEERAAAGGLPFNAKEVMDRAKKHTPKVPAIGGATGAQQQRHWRRTGRARGGRHLRSHARSSRSRRSSHSPSPRCS